MRRADGRVACRSTLSRRRIIGIFSECRNPPWFGVPPLSGAAFRVRWTQLFGVPVSLGQAVYFKRTSGTPGRRARQRISGSPGNRLSGCGTFLCRKAVYRLRPSGAPPMRLLCLCGRPTTPPPRTTSWGQNPIAQWRVWPFRWRPPTAQQRGKSWRQYCSSARHGVLLAERMARAGFDRVRRMGPNVVKDLNGNAAILAFLSERLVIQAPERDR